MVRHYVRKKEKQYSLDELLKAVEDVRSKTMNSYQAADVYGIPRSTIISRLYETNAMNDRPGRPTVFSIDFENNIAECLHIMERNGFPLTRKETKILISEYVRRNGIVTPFKHDLPGKDWFYGFQKRHNLSIKKPQPVEIARRKACDPFIVYGYFDMLEKVVEELGLSDKPKQIYNLDETSLCSDPVKGKVLGKKGYQSTRTTSGPGRNNTTVLLAINANGDKVPALIIFQGKHLWSEWVYKNKNVKTAYSVSEKGWMETSIFEKYLKETFVPAIGKERPVLLIYDGHATHVDLNVIKYAASESITILKLPPHSSHILQPLDCSTMKPLKDRWEEKIIQWQRLHIGVNLPKGEFARLLTEVWDEINPVILQNGFKRTGIYPLNRFAIPKELFDILTLQKWENAQTQLFEQDKPQPKDIMEPDVMNCVESTNDSNTVIVPSLLTLTLQTINELKLKRIEVKTAINGHLTEKNNRKRNLEVKSSRDIIRGAKMSLQGKENNVKIKQKTIIPQKYEKKNNQLNEEKCSKDILQIKKELNLNSRTKQNSKFIVQEPQKTLRTYERANKRDTNQSDKNFEKTKNPIPLQIPNRIDSSVLPNSLKILKCETIQLTREINKNIQEPNVTFEELLLKTVRRNDQPKIQKKRIINSTAEVLTYNNVIERMTEDHEKKEKIRLEKLKKKEAKLQNKEKKIQKTHKQRNKKHQQKSGHNQKKKKQQSKKYKKGIIDTDDSDSSGSYESINDSEDEDMESFFKSMLLTQQLEEDDMLTEKDFVADANIITEKPNKPFSIDSVDLSATSSKTQDPAYSYYKTKDPEKYKFVLAKFSSSKGKKTYKYVCMIEDVIDKKIVVQGFKSFKKNKQVFRIIDNDHSIIDNTDIISYLPDPKIKGSEYIFPFKIDVIEY